MESTIYKTIDCSLRVVLKRTKEMELLKEKKFPLKVMMWLGTCSRSISPLGIFEEGTFDHAQHIKEVLSVVLKYENKVFSND